MAEGSRQKRSCHSGGNTQGQFHEGLQGVIARGRKKQGPLGRNIVWKREKEGEHLKEIGGVGWFQRTRGGEVTGEEKPS